MKPIVDDGSGVQFDVTGLAYEPIVGLRQAETPAPAAAVADVTSDSGSVRDAAPSVMSSAGGLTSGAPMGIAIGEPTGLPGPIWVDDSFKVGDTNGDGFGDVIVIDDGSI